MVHTRSTSARDPRDMPRGARGAAVAAPRAVGFNKYRSSGSSSGGGSGANASLAPGRRTLTGQLQRRSAAAIAPAADVHRAAAAGIDGAAAALPHLAPIQAAFGGDHDLSSVRAHVGGAAAEASEQIGARAYAMGGDVAFAEAPDLHTAAHEAAHVVQQRGGLALDGGIGIDGDPHERHADAVADRVVRGESASELLATYGLGTIAAAPAVQRDAAPPKAGPPHEKLPLDREDEDEELKDLRAKQLDDAAIRTVQMLLDLPPTGAFDGATAQALAKLRLAQHLTKYGGLSPRIIDLLVQIAVKTRGMEDEAIYLVLDLYSMHARSDVLSVHFDPTLMVDAATSFDASGLRMISVGKTALDSARSIAKAVHAELARPVPDALASPPPGPVPTLLAADAARDADDVNRYRIGDPRAVITVQRMIGAPMTGTVDPATSQFIAEHQRAKGLSPVDGILNEATFEDLVFTLVNRGSEDTAIRLIVAYRQLPEDGVIDVAFDPALQGREFHIRSEGPGAPMTIEFSPLAVHQSADAIVDAVEHAYAEAQLNRAGTGAALRPFLAEQQLLVDPDHAPADFTLYMSDVVQAIGKFNRLAPDQQTTVGIAKLTAFKYAMLDRWDAGTPQERAAFPGLDDDVRALQIPPP
jgi:hypothetical protein